MRRQNFRVGAKTWAGTRHCGAGALIGVVAVAYRRLMIDGATGYRRLAQADRARGNGIVPKLGEKTNEAKVVSVCYCV
jgi:hypothetical protein